MESLLLNVPRGPFAVADGQKLDNHGAGDRQGQDGWRGLKQRALAQGSPDQPGNHNAADNAKARPLGLADLPKRFVEVGLRTLWIKQHAQV